MIDKYPMNNEILNYRSDLILPKPFCINLKLGKMKRANIFIIVVLLSIKVFSQNEYVYKNAEFGVEVTFPNKSERGKAFVISSDLTSSYGLDYSVTFLRTSKSTVNFTIKYQRSEPGLKSNYKVGEREVIERKVSPAEDLYKSGKWYQWKIICFEKTLIYLRVSCESHYPQDKDVLPFFNSLKIDGISIQNPTADNSLFNVYSLEKLSNGRTEPEKQIVYVKTKPDTVKQIIYVTSGAEPSYQYEKLSDVDKNIPLSSTTNPYRFALIIGNEDYSSHQTDLKSESNVDFARNDASSFKEYCMNMLGIPEKNITFLLDATVGQISQGVSLLKLLSKASGGKSQLIVFYAGHGLPDEKTKEPYLIPVDVNGSNVTAGIKLQDLYNNLTEFPSDRVMVFLDACFTGGGRNAGLVESRGVKIMPKKDVLKGNIVIFSSSSGEQSSLPYADQKHGMFTYYLLKKLQETKGDVTYSDLSEYLDEKVSIESLLVNKKEQNPVVNTSQVVTGTWKLWKVK
jgi:hypothetical protein